jgi:hypothetical protein
MMHLVRTVLHKISAQREKRQCEAQLRAIDANIAELQALLPDLKRGEAVERERIAMRLPRSYIHPAKWQEAR